MSYKVKIGLETHIELLTKSKIFCSCATEFNAAPNTHCCPVCMGLPGSMPNFNKNVLRLAIMAGELTNCTINSKVTFDRKNYFYPDLPKGYQITQHRNPICMNGYIDISNGKKIRINRIHMEEDAGKILYKEGKILIDYNRSGIPLLEVVTEPDMESSLEAIEYLEKLCSLIKNANISDCKMHEGSLRCDVNISVYQNGVDSVKVEIKNVNSFKFIEKAIEYEIKRQTEVLNSCGIIKSETRRYNEKLKITEPMRLKENRSDYRFIKEPDIPIFKTNDFI